MILAILQARMSSKRLPGKVMKTILEKPMIALQIERIQRSSQIDKLVVATSTQGEDGVIADLSKQLNITCYRGSLNDVLSRYYNAALPFNPNYVVRLTADCPLSEPTIIDQVIRFGVKNNYDYASNTLNPTFPDGLDIEIFRFSCLETANFRAQTPSQREHVTPFIINKDSGYRLGSYEGQEDLSQLRWTVDEPEDFEFVEKIYQSLYPNNPNFTSEDILALLTQCPELGSINSHYKRK